MSNRYLNQVYVENAVTDNFDNNELITYIVDPNSNASGDGSQIVATDVAISAVPIHAVHSAKISINEQMLHAANSKFASKVLGAQKIVSILIFAQFGTMLRVLLTASVIQWSSTNSILYQLGPSFFLANLFGCFVMGILTNAANRLLDYPALYVGITSGFCGACTTFSSWQASIAVAALRGQISDAILQLLLTFSTSYLCFLFGNHAAIGLLDIYDKYFKSATNKTTGGAENNMAVLQQKPKADKFTSYYVTLSISAFVLAVMVSCFWSLSFVDPSRSRRNWWIAVAFTLPGALTRYLLAQYNLNFPRFPLFTLVVNVIASVIVVVTDVIDSELRNCDVSCYEKRNSIQFWVLSGLDTGCMGSLSTVSTLMAELHKLTLQFGLIVAYRYGLVTVVLSQSICLLIGGVYRSTGRLL